MDGTTGVPVVVQIVKSVVRRAAIVEVSAVAEKRLFGFPGAAARHRRRLGTGKRNGKETGVTGSNEIGRETGSWSEKEIERLSGRGNVKGRERN